MYRIFIAFIAFITLCATHKLIAEDEYDTLKSLTQLLNEKRAELVVYRTKYPMEVGEHIIFPILQDIINYYMTDDHHIDNDSLIQKISTAEQGSTDGVLQPLMVSLLEKSLIANSDKISMEKKKEIIEFLVKYRASTEEIMFNASFFLSNFYGKNFYTDVARNIIKNILLNDRVNGDVLLLFDASGLSEDRDVLDFIRKRASLCEVWENRGIHWFSLLLLSKWGDKDAQCKLYKVAQVQLRAPNRAYQILYMPFELSLVQQPECVALLISFLSSDEEYMVTQSEKVYLGFNALLALSCIFPNIVTIQDVDIKSFIADKGNYISKFSPGMHIEQIGIGAYPDYAKYRIWR